MKWQSICIKNKIYVAIVCIIVPVAFVLGYFVIKAASYSYQSTPGTTITVNEHSICKDVQNSGSKSYFIPTKTVSEWVSFLDNVPVDISTSNCVTTPTFSGSGNCPTGVDRIDGSTNQLKFYESATGNVCATIDISGTAFSYSLNGGAYQSTGSISRWSGITHAESTPTTFTFSTEVQTSLAIRASGGVTFSFDGRLGISDDPRGLKSISASGSVLTMVWGGVFPYGGTTHWTMY